MFEDTYKMIAAPATGIYSEKRSKFLAYAFPVKTEEEVKKYLAELQKKHYDARHHCYAYMKNTTSWLDTNRWHHLWRYWWNC